MHGDADGRLTAIDAQPFNSEKFMNFGGKNNDTTGTGYDRD